MMDSLNDDCQLAIVKHFNLNDQIALYEASKSISKRLNREYKKFEDIPELLDLFLSNCSATVQELKLENVTLKFLKHWENYKFPRMKGLKYTLHYVFNDSKEAIRTMAKLFPGLHSLQVDVIFNCAELQKWTQMRKLHLTKCWQIYNNYEWSKEIVKCQLLEELTLDASRLWSTNYDDIMALPKLQKLCLRDASDYVLAEVLKNRAMDVHIFSNCQNTYTYMTTLRKMRNLRHFCIIDFRNQFTIENLRDLMKIWKQLEQIDINIWSREAELWQIVACCPTLKTLNILNTRLGKKFFEVSRQIMEETLNNRSQPLTLNCGYAYENKLHFKHPRLKLTFEPFKQYDDVDYNFIEIHFHPLQLS